MSNGRSSILYALLLETAQGVRDEEEAISGAWPHQTGLFGKLMKKKQNNYQAIKLKIIRNSTVIASLSRTSRFYVYLSE